MEEDFEDDQEFEGNEGIDGENSDGQQEVELTNIGTRLRSMFD